MLFRLDPSDLIKTRWVTWAGMRFNTLLLHFCVLHTMNSGILKCCFSEFPSRERMCTVCLLLCMLYFQVDSPWWRPWMSEFFIDGHLTLNISSLVSHPCPTYLWGQEHVSTWIHFCLLIFVSLWGRANPVDPENLSGSNSYTRTMSTMLTHQRLWIPYLYPTKTKISVS